MANRTVLHATLHQSVHMGGTVGTLGNTLPPTAKAVKMDMTLGEHGINIYFPDHKTYGMVPYANVVIMRLAAPEQVPVSAVKSGK